MIDGAVKWLHSSEDALQYGSLRRWATDVQHSRPTRSDEGSQTRRERARAATLTEIKQTALELMREHGTTDVRFTDIARVMGLTPPALYRYYADRDELLTDLITDGYRDLAAALAVAVRPDGARRPGRPPAAGRAGLPGLGQGRTRSGSR